MRFIKGFASTALVVLLFGPTTAARADIIANESSLSFGGTNLPGASPVPPARTPPRSAQPR